ncbi:MAG: hypothetical protein HY927_04885 [Elusimicrobia bacterium]|nr:hypothetical protein [Elusimicrobiota bacterium]
MKLSHSFVLSALVTSLGMAVLISPLNAADRRQAGSPYQGVSPSSAVPVFSDHNNFTSGFPPEALALRSEIQPLVTVAYRAHKDGDYAKSIPAFKSYFDTLIRRWPQSRTIANYPFEGRLAGESLFQPTTTRRMVEHALVDLRGLVLRGPRAGVDPKLSREVCSLIRKHFNEFAAEDKLAWIEQQLSSASIRIAPRPANQDDLLAIARRDKGGDVGDRAAYEKTTDDILTAAKQAKDPNWKAFLTFVAAQRHQALILNPELRLPDTRRQAVAAYMAVISSFPGAKFPIDDPVFDAIKGNPIAPYAHFALSRIYQPEQLRLLPQPQLDLIARELEIILRRYDNPKLVHRDGTPVLGNAAANLLRIYGDSEKGQKLAILLVTKYPNMEFTGGAWLHGETRPEAYSLLAKSEKDKAKKIKFLMHVITDYPGIWEQGKVMESGRRYDIAAASDILRLAANDKEKEVLCRRIIDSKGSPRAKEFAKNALRNLTLLQDASHLFVKPSTFSMVRWGCTFNYFMDSSKIPESQFRRWYGFSPLADEWQMMSPDVKLSRLQALNPAEVPPELIPLFDCYRKPLTYYPELNRRKEQFATSRDISILKQPIFGIDPTADCSQTLEIVESAKSRTFFPTAASNLALIDWHNCMNRAFRKDLCDDKGLWQSFLDKMGIQEVQVGECAPPGD